MITIWLFVIVCSIIFGISVASATVTVDFVVVYCVLMVVSTILTVHFFLQRRMAIDTLNELVEHWHELRDGQVVTLSTGEYDADTVLISYRAVFSFFITSPMESRYFRDVDPALNRISLMYTMFTILFGWWSLPHGPIETIKALNEHSSGGKRQTVRQVMEEIFAEQISELAKNGEQIIH